MPMTRREFIRLLCLSGGAVLLEACAPAEEPQEDPQPPQAWEPAYARLEAQGRLAERIEQADEILRECRLCPRRCGVNRLRGEIGFCRSPQDVRVFAFQPHYGEERPLVGAGGSGTIFFSHCNLRCVFCQNWPIAHEGRGVEVSDADLAEMMLRLQRRGCHNINLVTPTHVMPHILRATRLALHNGLRLPLCYNTSGYDALDSIRLLDGIVDIYLPDLKFMDGAQAERYNLAAARDYPQVAQQAILEMYRQVGNLVTDAGGIALRGLMIRHLVMPNRVAGTQAFVRWVADSLSTETYVNIMSQYRVEYRAYEFEEIARAITPEEFIEAMEWAAEAGLTNLDEHSLAQLAIYQSRWR